MAALPDRHVHPLSRAEWRAWLRDHHLEHDGVWLVRYKKAAGKPTVTWNEIVEEAISFGWIDSAPRKLDEERTMLYVSPRKAGSNWSRLSKARAQRMIEAGQMTDAGQAAIDRAKADGTWTVLEDVEDLIVPPDLEVALEDAPPARREWDGFPPSTRRGILEWILNAKRDTTRAKRIGDTARLAQQGKRANQWPRET